MIGPNLVSPLPDNCADFFQEARSAVSVDRISLIIATYNRGAQIGPTLDSVFAQTMPPSEVVVVDDGSTDETVVWIRTHYPAARVVTGRNGGTSASRNRGAAEAQGDILVFLDHDDLLLPTAVATLVGLLRRFPEARAAFADHELRNLVDDEFYPNHHSAQAAFHRMRRIPTLRSEGEERTYGRPMFEALLWGNLLQQPWAISKDVFRALGGFDATIRYCEDWELYLRVVDRYVIAVSDQVISTHMIEGGNLHRVSGQAEQHMKVLRKQLALVGIRDWRANATLRRRLGNYVKDEGDERRAAGRSGAWRAYVSSAMTWPFDMVVLIRCVLWAPSGLREWIVRGPVS